MTAAVFDGPAPSLRPLIVSGDALPGHAQRSTLALAAALTQRGVDVRLVFGADGPAAADARAARVAVLDLARWSGQRSPARGVAAALCAGSGLFHPVHLSSLGARAVRAGTVALRRRVPTLAHVRTPDDVEAALRLHRLGAHVITGSAAALHELVSRGAHRVEHVPDGADDADTDAAAPRSLAAARSRPQAGETGAAVLHGGARPPRDHDLIADGPPVDATSLLHVHATHVESVIDLYWRMTGLRSGLTPDP